MKLKHYVINYLSSGTIASYIGKQDYKTIDSVRSRMIKILSKEGDEPYTIVGMKKLATRAYDELKGTAKESVSPTMESRLRKYISKIIKEEIASSHYNVERDGTIVATFDNYDDALEFTHRKSLSGTKNGKLKIVKSKKYDENQNRLYEGRGFDGQTCKEYELDSSDTSVQMSYDNKPSIAQIKKDIYILQQAYSQNDPGFIKKFNPKIAIAYKSIVGWTAGIEVYASSDPNDRYISSPRPDEPTDKSMKPWRKVYKL